MSSTNMGRAWVIALPIVVVNAVLQALLLAPNTNPALSWWIWPLALISLLCAVTGLGLVIAAFLLGRTGTCSWGSAVRQVRTTWWRLGAYAIGLVVVVTAGLIAYVVPGVIVLAISPFVLIAVTAGTDDAIRANFRAIGAGWWRWIAFTFVTAIVGWLMWLTSALFAMFVPGVLGIFITWLIFGLAGVALTQLWCRAWSKSVAKAGPVAA